jgi:CheY-like chemotaxis protein
VFVAMASVLVSEADPDVRRLLVLLLERLGHEAVVLGPDAVPPPADLMLVEPGSPVCLEHARRARADSPELPIVGLNLVPAEGAFLSKGPFEYLPKPFTLGQLRDVVQRQLGCVRRGDG